jgi:restriction system protein
LLKFASDKNEHSSRESIEYLGQEFNLTEEDKKEFLPSGTQAIFDNRVGGPELILKRRVCFIKKTWIF